MNTCIKIFVVECDTYRQHKFESITPTSLLQPLNIPDKKWNEVSMDFITYLPTSKGKNNIFVILD